jgi:hypothetical protein
LYRVARRTAAPDGEDGCSTSCVRALAYHREISAHIRLEPRLVHAATRRVNSWRNAGAIHSYWADKWDAVLSLPPAELEHALVAENSTADALRLRSPFIDSLPDAVRDRIIAELGEARLMNDAR